MKTHKYKGYEYVKAKWGFYIKLTDGNWAGFHKYCGLRKTIDWLNHDTLIEGTLYITTTEQLKEYLAKESKNEQENKKQRLSNRMKRTHKYASIMGKLVLTQINGEWVFKLDRLSQEERDFIQSQWCNAL